MNTEAPYKLLPNEGEKSQFPKKIRFTLFFNHINSLIKTIPKLSKLQNFHTKEYFLRSCALTPDEIFEEIDEKVSESAQTPERIFSQQRIYADFKRKFTNRFILIGFLRFLANLLLFSGPIFLDLLTDSYKTFENESSDSTLKLKNVSFSIALALCFVLFSLVESQYSWNLSRLENDIKVYFQYLLYQKGLVAKAIDETTTENKENQEIKSTKIANFTNLLTIDINSVLNFIQSFHQTWSQLLNLLIGLALLFIKMRSAIFIGFFAVCIVVIVNFQVAKKIGSIYEKMMQYKDMRISLTQDVLLGIRQIKYLNWESIFERKIQEIRAKEFQCLKTAKYLDALCVFFWATTTVVISTFSFVAYDALDEDVRKINVFTAISLFNILIFPLNALPWTIGGMLTGRVSLRRLLDFFSMPEVAHSQNPRISQENTENAVFVQKLSFAWPTLEKKPEDEVGNLPFSLKNIELQVKVGSLTMIVGKIGAGKSALANALLKEMEMFEEFPLKNDLCAGDGEEKLGINGKIAYVSQNTWLQNTTIRENILFGKKFDENWYNFCVRACELVQDLETFKKKDFHEVGSEGFCLSGGQKQRISLCRALYQDNDIYIFDDIFSSVDAEVATRIFENVILYLHQQHKTILLILSQYRFLKYATQIILLKDGELIKNTEEINEYLKNVTLSIPSTEKSDGNSIKPEEKAEELHFFHKNNEFFEENFAERGINSPSSFIKEEENSNTGVTDEKNPLKLIDDSTINIKETAKNSLVNEEKNEEIREEGEIKLKAIMIYVIGMGTVFFFLIVLTMAMMQICRNFFDIWLKEYVNYNTVFLFEDNFRLTLICIAVFTIFWTLMRAFCFAVANLRASKNIFLKLLNSVIYSKMHFFENNAVGRIINRFSGDTQAIDDRISFESNILMNNIFILTGSLIVIVIQNIYVFICVPFIGILFYFIQKRYRHSSREIKRLDAVNYSTLLTHISETSNGVKIIRAHKKQPFFIDNLKTKLINSNSSSFLISAISCWLSIRLQFLSTIITCVILLVSMIMLLTDQNPDANSFALSLSYSLSITSLLRDLIMSITSTERECISIERINQYLHNSKEKIHELSKKNHKVSNFSEPTHNNAIFTENNNNNANNFNIDIENVVEFRNVWLKYDENSQHYALKNISFQIKPHQKIAFCGRTGCGKTSILNCLFRLYEIDKGEVFFMGQNIKSLQLSELRSKISVVPQLGFLFKGTIKENLDPDNEFDYKYIEEIISETKFDLKSSKEKKIQNNEQESISSLKGSFLKEEFFVEAGGKNLSNGEKQIINFLRILLRNSEIVCLDEATSNLDPYTDEIINELIMKFSNKTLILITHRVHSLKYFDKIFVMNEGEICEQGTYQQLKDDSNSFFNLFAQHSDDK